MFSLNTHRVYTLFWIWSDVSSHFFTHHDVSFSGFDWGITDRVAPFAHKKNTLSWLSLPYCCISIFSSRHTHCFILRECLYFLSLWSPLSINMIFAPLYNFFTRTHIDENRRCIDYSYAHYSYPKIGWYCVALHRMIFYRKRWWYKLCMCLSQQK